MTIYATRPEKQHWDEFDYWPSYSRPQTTVFLEPDHRPTGLVDSRGHAIVALAEKIGFKL
jgi:hypothetical protein